MPKTYKYNGQKFHSLFEVAFAEDLDRRGIPYEREAETFEASLIYHITPDFVIRRKGKRPVYVETKGYHKNMLAKLRILANFRDQHPEIDYRMIIPRQDIRLGKRQTLADWCDKHKIKYARDVLPDSWLKE